MQLLNILQFFRGGSLSRSGSVSQSVSQLGSLSGFSEIRKMEVLVVMQTHDIYVVFNVHCSLTEFCIFLYSSVNDAVWYALYIPVYDTTLYYSIVKLCQAHQC